MPENWFEKQKSARAKRRTARHKDIAPRWCPRKSGRGIALPWTLADVGIPASRRILKGGESDPFCVSLLRVVLFAIPRSSRSLPLHILLLFLLLSTPARDEHIRAAPSFHDERVRKGELPFVFANARARALARVSAAAYMCVCVYSMRECKLSHVGLQVCTTGWRMKNEVRSLRTFRAVVCGRVEGGDCAKGASLFPRCMYTTSFET